MNNIVLIIIYAALAAVSLTLIIMSRRKPKRIALDSRFVFVVSMLFIWQVLLVLYNASTDKAVSAYLYDLDLPFVAFTSLGWFLYVVRFYGLDSYFPKVVVGALAVIPLFTFVLCVTTPLHEFIRINLEVVSTTPLHVVSSGRGMWFWYHAFYCYVMLTASLVLVLYQHRKIGRAYKRASLYLLVGLVVGIAGNIMVLAARTPVDLSLVMAGVASVLLYVATQNNQSYNFFLQARMKIFHYMDKAIFVLDNDNGIVNVNDTAKRWLMQLGIAIEGRSYENIVEKLQKRMVKIDKLEDEEGGTDYYLDSGHVYNIRRKPIMDNRQNQIGTFLISTDVKQNRSVIGYLDDVAGMDILTGLSNRRHMQQDVEKLDVPGSLPLAVIIGDLNNLKSTNDRFGHAQGDVYLRVAAETLRTTCPPGAHIARIGGDEFSILIPEYTAEQTQELAQEIKTAFGRLSGYVFAPSIALGWAVKTGPDEDMQALIRQADEAMYRDKKEGRRSAGGA